jgi:hypothetical protein
VVSRGCAGYDVIGPDSEGRYPIGALLGHDPGRIHSLRHLPEGTAGAVELAWVNDRYVEVCRPCGAHDCGDHERDPAIVRTYHEGFTA